MESPAAAPAAVVAALLEVRDGRGCVDDDEEEAEDPEKKVERLAYQMEQDALFHDDLRRDIYGEDYVPPLPAVPAVGAVGRLGAGKGGGSGAGAGLGAGGSSSSMSRFDDDATTPAALTRKPKSRFDEAAMRRQIEQELMAEMSPASSQYRPPASALGWGQDQEMVQFQGRGRGQENLLQMEQARQLEVLRMQQEIEQMEMQQQQEL